MNDELIDILNKDGSFQKTALKSEAHKYGWLHASVHIWFYTSDGNLLFQKRSPTKKVFPNMWDVSVAGHIGAGESAQTSAVREVMEEIGLEITAPELNFIASYKEHHTYNENIIDNEIHHTYICELKFPISNLILQTEEVVAIKLISINDFEQQLTRQNISDFVPHDIDYYLLVIEAIKNNLKINS
ncbi:NUDIX domain-containing protein [Urechidicola sp. KH5]